MATPSITQAELKSIIAGTTHSKFSQCADTTVTMNRAVKYVLGDVDVRSLKRSAQLSPNLFDNVYEYTAPSDLKGEKIIDFRKQVNRSSFERFSLVADAEFDRKKASQKFRVAVRDENFGKILRIAGLVGGASQVIHDCDSLTANGTWAASADASNLTRDVDNYIQGNAALNFDMAKGAATGVLELTGATQVDLTDYEDKGSVFVWVFIPDYSDAQADTVTNFILRVGNDSSNYFSITVTTNNEGAQFKDGWNLLRFDLNGATETGSVNPATIDYLRLTVTKSTSLEADTDWRVDYFIARLGSIYDVVYYGKYGWVTAALAYIEESTTTTDLVVCDTDEIEGIAFKASEYAAQELKEYDDAGYFKNEYAIWKKQYEANNPSEALKKTNRYGVDPRIRRY